MLKSKGQAAATEEEPDRLLGSAGRSCLRLANQQGLKSIAFPAVSCGVFKFPGDRAANVGSQMQSCMCFRKQAQARAAPSCLSALARPVCYGLVMQVAMSVAREEAGQLEAIHWVLYDDKAPRTWRQAAEDLLGERGKGKM